MTTLFNEKEKNKMDKAEQLKTASQTQGIFYCTRADANFPSALKTINNMPPLLYYKGNIEIINQNKNVAIIGSRHFSATGRDASFQAEKTSGTMHTASYAINQYKRLACYYHGLMKLSSGNKYLEDMGKAKIIKTNTDLESFFQDILTETDYEQLTFQFK